MLLYSFRTFLGFATRLSLVCSYLGTSGTTFAGIRSRVRYVTLEFVYAYFRRRPRPSRSPRFLLLGRIDMLCGRSLGAPVESATR